MAMILRNIISFHYHRVDAISNMW